MKVRIVLVLGIAALLVPTVSFAATSYTFSAGFSSTQGANQWSYYVGGGGTYTPMTWDATSSVWRGSESGGYPIIWAGGAHPGNASDAVIKWIAPSTGTYRITGAVAKGDPSCGDGVIASILQNTTTLWSATIAYRDTVGKSHDLTVNAAAGDSVYFVVNRNGEYSCDSTSWNPTVTRIASMGGALDDFTGGMAVGWALNADDPLQPTTVKFYFDGPYNQGGTYVGSVVTSLPRPDLNVTGNHGYSFTVPEQYLDGATHTIYAYAVAPDNSLFALQTSPKTGTVSCGLSHCSLLPISSNDGHIKVEAVGNAQYAFKYSTDRCAQGDGPDSPARAFRDTSGNVVFSTATDANTYRSTGPTLASVQRACVSGSIMGTGNNPDYNAITDQEWPTAPYSTDGTNVYALVHNEWHRPELLNPSCAVGQAWVNSITLAASTDGGLHFSHPADYKIRTPEPWNNSFLCSAASWTQMGSFEPTNIVQKDGYYYSIFTFISAPVAPYTSGRGPVLGDCVMRTQDLSKGSAWQVWTGSSWASAAGTSICTPVISDGDVKTISYNTYLHSYIAVGGRYDGSGFGYTLSQDLVHWSPMVAFLPTPISQGPAAYISILDPADTTRNFEQSGQTPYIYLVLIGTRDIIRQQIRFTDLTPPPTCTPNWSCSAWNQCSASGQSRICTDTNACNVTTNKPVELQSCATPVVPNVPVPTLPTVVPTAPVATTSATTTLVQTTAQKIAALLAQIKQLQALITTLTGSSPSTIVPTQSPAVTYNGTCPVLPRNLSHGSRGADVTALQTFFFNAYQDFSSPTGYFGSITEAALKQWQEEHGIVSSGSPTTTGYGAVGPKTRAAIAEACK